MSHFPLYNKDQTIILNKTTRARDRYRILIEPNGKNGSGSYGEPPDSPLLKYSIVEGSDRGNGWQGYMSIKYILETDYIPAEAKRNLIKFLKSKGYGAWLKRNGY